MKVAQDCESFQILPRLTCCMWLAGHDPGRAVRREGACAGHRAARVRRAVLRVLALRLAAALLPRCACPAAYQASVDLDASEKWACGAVNVSVKPVHQLGQLRCIWVAFDPVAGCRINVMVHAVPACSCMLKAALHIMLQDLSTSNVAQRLTFSAAPDTDPGLGRCARRRPLHLLRSNAAGRAGPGADHLAGRGGGCACGLGPYPRRTAAAWCAPLVASVTFDMF